MNRRKEGKRRGKKGKEEGKEGSKRKGGKEEGKGREERRRKRRKKREGGTEGHAVSRRAGCSSGPLASLPVRSPPCGPGLRPPSPRPLRHRGAGRLRRASRRASVPCRADGFVPPGSCQVSASCCYFVLLERDWCCFPERPY